LIPEYQETKKAALTMRTAVKIFFPYRNKTAKVGFFNCQVAAAALFPLHHIKA
jgi:hypothetical protein